MKILAVNDTRAGLGNLKDTIETTGFELITASSGQEALQVLEKEYGNVSLVLLYWNEPDTDGYETLLAIKGDERFRSIPVIMLCADYYQPKEMQAFKAGANACLTIPFNQKDLAAKISETLGKRGMILAKLARISNLPTAPPVLVALLQKLNDENYTIDDLVSLIEEDVALSAKILAVANSPAYRGTSEITSVRTAAVRLGFDEIKDISMVAIISSSLSSLTIPNLGRFWIHSLAVGYTAQVLARRAGRKFPPRLKGYLFTAGLLHDLGSLVLYHLFSKEVQILYDRLPETDLTMYQLEEESLGIDHAEVGAYVARHWKLPEAIREAIAFHHAPWQASSSMKPLVSAVHLADFICNNQEFSWIDDNFPREFDSSSWELFDMDLDDVPEIIDEVKEIGQKSEIFAALL